MLAITIRPFSPTDLERVVGLWNRCLPYDGLDSERFYRLYLLDPNRLPSGMLVAERGAEVIGYLQTITSKAPPGYVLVAPREGHLTAFFVAPDFRGRGIAGGLLDAGLDALRTTGCHAETCNGYSPLYAFPGVDHRYEEARRFLSSRVFEPLAGAVAMRRSLEGLQIPDEVRACRDALVAKGYELRWFRPEDTLPLLWFAESHFPYWLSGLVE